MENPFCMTSNGSFCFHVHNKEAIVTFIGNWIGYLQVVGFRKQRLLFLHRRGRGDAWAVFIFENIHHFLMHNDKFNYVWRANIMNVCLALFRGFTLRLSVILAVMVILLLLHVAGCG